MTTPEVLERAITERDWMQLVIDFARLQGWLVYHTHDSRRSPSGFPDVICVRGDRLVALETKTTLGRVTRAQLRWMDALRGVPGVEAWVARPDDWDAIEEVLR